MMHSKRAPIASWRWSHHAVAVVVAISIAALLGVSSGTALAQQPAYSYANVRAQCSGSGITVTLVAYDRGERPDIVGFHVYRKTVGSCASRTRITVNPLPRTIGVDFTQSIVDGQADPTLAHDYWVVAVDTQGHEIDPYLLYLGVDSSMNDIASCSATAPIALGTVYDQGWALWIEPCASSCFASVLIEEFPEALRALAGTGTPVLVQGFFGCGTVEGCLGHAVSFQTTSCVVSVQPSLWGDVKKRYR